MPLGLTGLIGRFEGLLFSATEVARPKPAPDVFLLAAERMGVALRDAVVIEDTPIGVTAGRSAGMTVFGYAGLISGYRLREAGASVVFTDMAELTNLLGGSEIDAGLVYSL
jgi:beta-phosphoglucomutase-like phosphatase (HAD superfamily)